MIKALTFALCLPVVLDVCGYHQAGRGKSLPKNIKTIAIPAFKNSSLKYRVEQRFTRAVMEEVLRRARGIRVTTNPDEADAVLTGDIRTFRAAGTILDDRGRTRVWDVTIGIAVTIRDVKNHKILYDNPRMSFDGEYELSDDPQSFFNEENPAVDRIAKDFAQSLISTILEGL